MQAGKVKISKLKNLVLDRLSSNNSDVLVGPKLGEDSAVIDFGEFVAVMSTDPITGIKEGVGTLAVNISCNDIAANGAQPIGIQQALLIPPNMSEQEVVAIVEDINQATKNLGIDVLGGHTEVTDIVKQPLVSCTAIGKTTKDKFITSSDAQIGDDIVVTKWTGLEGTSILANTFNDKLLKLGVKKEVINEALNLTKDISVVPEGLLGANLGVNAMHDVTEGGLYGALYELTTASEVGFKIEQEKLPVHKVTEIITTALNINPYSLIGSGMMILITDKGSELVKKLNKEKIKASIIGKITPKNKIVRTNEGKIEIETAPEDELWRILKENNK
ncbi:hydrogenase maturation factor [Halobacteroides halobius DSM 5150]|uniref:Hydrogenase maturation factor n=1 Tax=Halobacteroides halobius (strain ATCC 35273 / DSM 5150 / MD-1) TaxID=748449 RepID=L0KA34_HALHC|nr:AIR synthase family protein [Halobacteroides halobius]AGB41234.1 hydrogenase maturation factor [Halobacteroides halobius DSM 5150]